MDRRCEKCGAKLPEIADFCGNCGEKISSPKKKFINKYVVAIVIAVIIVAVFASIFMMENQTQIVTVDDVQFRIPSSYIKDSSRTDVSYDDNIKSSAMGWSNDENYIEIGVTRTPGAGIDSQKVASTLNGTPTKMLGYSGYYLEYENEGCAFVFGLKDEVCMIYVNDYDAFNDVEVIGAVN